MNDHSACAAMFGICECLNCQTQGLKRPTQYVAVVEPKVTDYWLFTLRSCKTDLLYEYRKVMQAMGFEVTWPKPVEPWMPWPKTWYYFDAKALKVNISAEQLGVLAEWDRRLA